MLCRLPRGMELVVPERLWRDLSPAARRAILRHELAHYLRGDVWKSLAARVLALPHWFNPVAWLAVRRFEEAAEWACDAAAADDSATDYARVLLQLGEAAPQPAYASSAGGRTLAARIRRVLAGPARPDSRLKKTAIVTVALLLVGASLVQLNLVAKQPSEQPSERQVAAADPQDPPAEEDPFAAPPRVNSVDAAEPPGDEQPIGLVPKTANQGSPHDSSTGDRTAEVAEQAFWAANSAWEAENSKVEPLYDWSVRWMNALERAAPDKEIKLAAAQAHVKRMYNLNKKCRLLYQVGTKGGEAQQYHSTKFYLAEAERHLAELKTTLAGEDKKDSTAVASIDATALDAVKQAYQSALGELEPGKLNLGDLYEWSERWRELVDRVAIDQNGRTKAAQDHLDRLRDVSKRTDALQQAGAIDGNQLNAAKRSSPTPNGKWPTPTLTSLLRRSFAARRNRQRNPSEPRRSNASSRTFGTMANRPKPGRRCPSRPPRRPTSRSSRSTSIASRNVATRRRSV